MNKFNRYLLLGTLLIGFNSTAKAFDGMPSLEISQRSSIEMNQFAAIQFLPDMEDSELGFGSRELKNNHNANANVTGDCRDYKIIKGKCPKPKEPVNACPFNASKFMDCICNLYKFKYNQTNCVYTANGAPYKSNPDRLLSDTCRNDPQSLLNAKNCLCNTFRYTNDASCGNSDKVIDDRSYCQANDEEIRYEACKCKREIYPFIFKGNFKSAEFKNQVKQDCGHPKNFISCKNFDDENTYKCAVDPSYKYDNENCTEENSLYAPQGSSQTFTNGYGERVTLFKQCDCPSSYTSSCDGKKGSSFYTADGGRLYCVEKHPTCSWGFYDEMEVVGPYNCKDHKHGSIIEVSASCKKKNGTSVYRCRCKYTDGDWDYHGEMCGTCANKTNHVYCVENGVNKSNSCVN